jgi:hypothetical protein
MISALRFEISKLRSFFLSAPSVLSVSAVVKNARATTQATS